MNEGTSDSVPLVSASLSSRDSKRLPFRKEELHMLELRVEAEILVGQGCRCNFGGAQANWIGDSRKPRAGVGFALSDHLRGSSDFFLGDSDMDFVRATAAARA